MFYYAFMSYSSSAVWILQYLIQEVSLHCSLPPIESIGQAFEPGTLADFVFKS